MKRQDYYPSLIGEQVRWLQHFANTLPAHADTLGLAAIVVADAVADALWVAYTLGPWRTAIRTFSKAATSAIEAVQTGTGNTPGGLPAFTVPHLDGAAPRPHGALRRIFRLVQVIKASAGCNAAIATALGIHTIADDRQHPAPSLSATAERGAAGEEAVLRMEKWDHTALYLETRRGGGPWEKLTITTLPIHRDPRPLLTSGQPEIREYRARFYDDNSPTGDWSPVVRVTISP